MADIETDGLYPVTWDSCDGCDCGSLFGSPQDAQGRGILLTITRDGAVVDLSDEKYKLYFLWLHRQQHTRGCVAMDAVDAAAGKFRVFFPAGMIAHEGEAVCSVVLSWGDKTLATPTFSVRIDEALVSTLSIEDGFTLFAEALKAYETGTADLLSLVVDLTTMRDSGEFDGEDGAQGPQGERGETGEAGPAGADGVSCTHSWDGTVLTVTSASGTSSAVVARVTHTDGSTVLGYLPLSSCSAERAVFAGPLLSTAADSRSRYLRLQLDGSEVTALTSGDDGYGDTASGLDAHAEGRFTTASGDGSHAEGYRCKAAGAYSHAEGYSTTASGQNCHVEGRNTYAYGIASHAEGYACSACGYGSHAGGYYNWADGFLKRVGGMWAAREASVWGFGHAYAAGDLVLYQNAPYRCKAAHTASSSVTPANTDYWEAEGLDAPGKYAAVVGNGTSDTARSNACALDWEGNAYFAGGVYAGSGEAGDAARRLCTVEEAEALVAGASGAPVDLSGYAQLSGAAFTGAVTGLTPTADAELATKGYVDGAVPSLDGYATQAWVKGYLAETFPDLSGVSY